MEEKRGVSFIFDIDGVLLDVKNSYYQTVIAVIKELLGVDIGINEVLKFKRIKGFNDDWDIAVALFSFYRHRCAKDLDLYVSMLDGKGIDGVFEFCETSREEVDLVVRMCKEIYGGIDRCEYLFGFRPERWNKEGLYKNEIPLVSLSDIPQGVDIGIVTGRNRKEAKLALELLGWEEFISIDRVVTTDDGIKKPDPLALKILFDKSNPQKAVYFGDGMDDCLLVQNYKKKWQIPQVFFCGIYDSLEKKELFLREGAEFVAPSLKVGLSIVADTSEFGNIS